MKCPKCRFENREGTRFCLRCGERLEITCPGCGRSLPGEARFCDDCGHSLKEGEGISGVEFRLRVGLNSGPVIVGSIGDDLRMDYTAVGDTTNLASRMEGLAAPGTVLVSHRTHRAAGDYFEFRALGRGGGQGQGGAPGGL